MSAKAASSKRRREFRFQLNRCSCPNRSVARISALKEQKIVNPTLFQVQEGINSTVLTALVEVFQYFVETGIQWRTLHIEETNNTDLDLSLWNQLFRTANEAKLFRTIHIKLNRTTPMELNIPFPADLQNMNLQNMNLQNMNLNIAAQRPPVDLGRFLQSIESNARLGKLCFSINTSLSTEDVQSLNRLLKSAKKLKHLELCYSELNTTPLSEGLQENTTLECLSLCSPQSTGGRRSSLDAVMMELSQNAAMRLRKLTLSSRGDTHFSSSLESLLISKDTLKVINIHCEGSYQVLGPFFRRLNGLLPAKKEYETEQNREIEEQLIERGPLISLDMNWHRIKPEDCDLVNGALRNYPKLRFSSQCPVQIGYQNLLNTSGRYLMNLSDVPLALWPNILERISCLAVEAHKRRRSSVIYELLHGGAFAAKEAYASI